MVGNFGVFILLVLMGHSAALHEVCKPRQCISGQAICVNKHCVCQAPFTWGDGRFVCYKKDQVATEIKNDPQLTTFNNESSNFPYPCRYLVTAVKQQLKSKLNHNIGNCTFRVYAFNKRFNGKIIVHGYDVALRLEAPHFSKNLSIITYGTSGNVTEGGTDNAYLPLGNHGTHLKSSATPIFSDHIRNIFVKRFYLSHNNQYVFEVDACGFRASFVPYDTTLGLDQPNIPGLSVAINIAHHPQWYSKGISMGLPPVDAGGFTMEQMREVYPGLNTVQALLRRAITSGVIQSQPDASHKCSVLKTTVNNCDKTEQAKAFKYCTPILETSHLVKCISNQPPKSANADAVLGFFNACINHFCHGGGQCPLFRHVDQSCHDPALKKLISEQCH